MSDTRDKINVINAELDLLKRQERELRERLVTAHYEDLMARGIRRGGRVRVGKDIGIFIELWDLMNRIKPHIMKMKKDGTAHSTASVFCYDVDAMLQVNPVEDAQYSGTQAEELEKMYAGGNER